jgi:diguanylate cyclase
MIAFLSHDLPSLAKPISMKKIVADIWQKLFPPIPNGISDDFALLRADRIRNQTPILLITLFITTPSTAFVSVEEAPALIRFGYPIIMGLMCIMGFWAQFRTRHMPIKPRRARYMIRRSDWGMGIGAILCSIWCISNWLYAAPETRIHYPMIMAMSSLATAYSLSTMRSAAVFNLCIGPFPVSLLMIFAGSALDIAAGISMLVASIFLLRMIFQQHDGLVKLLTLQRQMSQLATTDPLTGLLNRRALAEELNIQMADANRPFAIALLDLDGFKPVNDRYGHATGDILLCEVANRLRMACDGSAVIARMGGDEFAILVSHGSSLLSSDIPSHLLAALSPPYLINDHIIRVGASIGVAHWPQDGANTDALFEIADCALYAVKATVKSNSVANQRVTNATIRAKR